MSIIDYLFGSFSDQQLKKIQPYIDAINAKEAFYQSQPFDFFAKSMNQWKEQYKNGKTNLNDYIIDVFAAVREVGVRVLKKRLFDVQLIGSLVLHFGMIAEMKTGEGKTLVSGPAVVLNAITEKAIHVVTVNDYLTERDSEILKPIFTAFGLSVGYVIDSTSHIDKKRAYNCDVTFCSNNQIAFDYLRDNMCTSLDEKLQRGLYFAIIDEVDNILIDEARTPLIISDAGRENVRFYGNINPIMYNLQYLKDYEMDSKQKNVYLTKEGSKIIENYLLENGIISGSLFENKNVAIYHVVTNLLKAHKSMEKDKDYVVRNGEVIIIDEFTGRLANGRRFSNGLHQAIEAKEQLNIKPESVMRASISYTNFFRLYEKIAGMTGTGMSEEEEFTEIYNLRVIKIPTNKPIRRIDHPDIYLYRYFSTLNEDLVAMIKEKHSKNQPMLICTPSVAYSEMVSDLLNDHNVTHNLLNAKNNEREAFMIAQAGQPGAITVSTSMAGRGTDIQLGGSIEMAVKEVLAHNPGLSPTHIEEHLMPEFAKAKEEVIKAGGLCVIIVGTAECEKSELQFMGRAGRQGDIGESYRFYCLEDNLLRTLSESDGINKVMIDFWFPESKRVHTGSRVFDVVRPIQATFQASYFEMRRNLLKYDNVINDQRKTSYDFRDFIMKTDKVGHLLMNILKEFIEDNKNNNIALMNEKFSVLTNSNIELQSIDDFYEIVNNIVTGDKVSPEMLKRIILRGFDNLWYKHIITMDNLKKTIQLVTYAQKDPVQEFKKKAYDLYVKMFKEFYEQSVLEILRIHHSNSIDTVSDNEDDDSCMCGSGLPFEQCHGKEFSELFNSLKRKEITENSSENEEFNISDLMQSFDDLFKKFNDNESAMEQSIDHDEVNDSENLENNSKEIPVIKPKKPRTTKEKTVTIQNNIKKTKEKISKDVMENLVKEAKESEMTKKTNLKISKKIPEMKKNLRPIVEEKPNLRKKKNASHLKKEEFIQNINETPYKPDIKRGKKVEKNIINDGIIKKTPVKTSDKKQLTKTMVNTIKTPEKPIKNKNKSEEKPNKTMEKPRKPKKT